MQDSHELVGFAFVRSTNLGPPYSVYRAVFFDVFPWEESEPVLIEVSREMNLFTLEVPETYPLPWGQVGRNLSRAVQAGN